MALQIDLDLRTTLSHCDRVQRFIEESNQQHHRSPTYREMEAELGLGRKTLQESVADLQRRGYIEVLPGARGIRVLRWRFVHRGIPIWGEIAAGYLAQPCTNSRDYLDTEIPSLLSIDLFALLVSGHSMMEAGIVDRSHVVMEKVPDNYEPQDGEIVAAYVEGEGMTLKRFHREKKRAVLRPANQQYQDMSIDLSQKVIRVQGKWKQTVIGGTVISYDD